MNAARTVRTMRSHGGALRPSATGGATTTPETGTDRIGRPGSSHAIWIDLENAPISCGVSETESIAEPFGGIFIADSSAFAPQHALTRETDTVAFPALRSSIRPTAFEPTNTSPNAIPSGGTANLGAAIAAHATNRPPEITTNGFTASELLAARNSSNETLRRRFICIATHLFVRHHLRRGSLRKEFAFLRCILARPAVLITSRFVCDSCSFHHDSSAKLFLAYLTLFSHSIKKF